LFGAILLGMGLQAIIPPTHLSEEAKDSVRIGMGSIATMTALVLGLLVASTKSDYDREKKEVTQLAAKVDYLDRVLADYGTQAEESRAILRTAVESALTRMWPEEKVKQAEPDPSSAWAEALPTSIEKLAPQNDLQKAIQFRAVELANELAETRWLLYEQNESSVSTAMLVIVIGWLAIIFVSVGLFAPRNPTVIIALMMAAMSVAGAVFLILELDLAFDGIVKISSAPMRNALEHLGRR
jgi:hypothetical protein